MSQNNHLKLRGQRLAGGSRRVSRSSRRRIPRRFATRAAARLLLAELAAALCVEPQRQAHQGAAEGAGLPRTRRRREQRRAAAARLLSSGAAVSGGLDECGEPTKQAKDGSVAKSHLKLRGQRLAGGSRRVTRSSRRRIQPQIAARTRARASRRAVQTVRERCRSASRCCSSSSRHSRPPHRRRWFRGQRRWRWRSSARNYEDWNIELGHTSRRTSTSRRVTSSAS